LGVAPSIEHVGVLRRLAVDRIIDVGANRGQFSLACRLTLPNVPIVAFEPIPKEAAVFREAHKGCQHVQLIEVALGESESSATLHLSRSADSSSLLPITQQSEYFQQTDEVGTLNVPVKTLDKVSLDWTPSRRQLLKLDVQGFELKVLQGAKRFLSECIYVYVECSEVELYEGQALRKEVESFLGSQGFQRASRHNELFHKGELIQADYLFERTPEATSGP
jgi:FkbM family methyltransferase